jgi:site-specific DNA-methyltransferase (adenine-specific)
VGARPVALKKGADHGIDGKILFRDAQKASKAEQIIVLVKSGKIGVKDMRDLHGVRDREKAAMGVLIPLQQPARNITRAASSTSGRAKNQIPIIRWGEGRRLNPDAPLARRF